jgi:hypothetical protein
MALPNPPNNVPQIIDVQNPSSNHHIVSVKMPTNLASKWPSKAWGTSIADIGLSAKDAALYPNYVLVDVEPIKNTPDLLWIFQKLDGPEWKTKSTGVPNLAPAKFSNQITTIQKRREVDPLTDPSSLGGNLISSIIQQKDDTGKAIEVNTEEIITSSSSLIGEVTDTWGVNKTEESYVIEGTPVESGFGIKASKVVPIGMGKAVKITEEYPNAINKLEGEECDRETSAVIQTSKHLVDATLASSFADQLRNSGGIINQVEVQPLDKWHSIVIANKMNDLPDVQEWQETTEISLPAKLKKVGVVWDTSESVEENSSGVNNISIIRAKNYKWEITALGKIQATCSGAPFIDIEPGLRGTALVNVKREYFHEAPLVDINSVHVFKPVIGILQINGFSVTDARKVVWNGIGNRKFSDDYNNSYDIDDKLIISTFGPFEHESISPTPDNMGDDPNIVKDIYSTTGSTPDAFIIDNPTVAFTFQKSGSATLTLPASSIPLAKGDTYVSNIIVKPWRLGKWVRETYTVTVP